MTNRILTAITLAFAGLFCILPIRADDQSGPSVSVAPTYVSSYMFRGVLLSKDSFQPSVTATDGNLSLTVWSSMPLIAKDRLRGEPGTEIDPQGSYTLTISDALSIQPGFTWYTYSKASDGDGFYRSTFEPNLAVNYTLDGVTVTPKAYYDVVLRGPTYELTATHSTPWKALGTEVDLTGTIGTYDQKNTVKGAKSDVKAWGNYWLLGVNLPFTLGKHSEVGVGWAYTKGWDAYSKEGKLSKELNTSAVGRGVATASYTYTF